MHIQGNGSLQVAGDLADYVNDGQAYASRPGNSAEIDCPACHAGISPLATVCRHCRTNVLQFRATVERERLRQITRRAAYIGVASAVAGLLTGFLGADLLPMWLTSASEYLGASGVALTAVSLAAKP